MSAEPSERQVEAGRIAHYYPKIEVAVVELKETLTVGDRVLIRGSTTNFEQVVESIQIEHEDVHRAESGQSIGLKVRGKVRENDVVYKIG